MDVRRVAVIGAGLMGTNIALDFARAEFEVTITDRSAELLDRSRATQHTNAAVLYAAQLTGDPPEVITARITGCSGVPDAVCDADLVVEAISEDLERKQELFGRLAFYSPAHAILASNTSSFMPDDLALRSARAENVVVTHYFNPAHLVPLVELVPGSETAPGIVETLRTLYRRIGKQPVVVRRAVPGFIGNRLQFAMLREALALVEAGVATPEDVDTAVRAGFGRRLPETGIFRTFDLGGLDTIHTICGILFPHLDTRTDAGSALTALVEQGRLGAKSGAGWYNYADGEADAVRTRLAAALVRAAVQDQEPRAK